MEKKDYVIEDATEEKKKESGRKCYLANPNVQKILGAVLMALLIFGGIAKKNGYFDKIMPAKSLSTEQIGEKVNKFITANVGQEGIKVETISIIEEDGLYKITLSIQDQENVFYASKSGKMIFQGTNMDGDAANKAEVKEDQPIAKSDKPVVDLYVMSFCPYGNQSEDTLKPVYDLLKNKVTFNFHYIVNMNGEKVESLHGQPEVDQNEREACVLKDYGKDKWFDFVLYVNKNCGSDGVCWEAGAKSLGINVAKLNSCVRTSGLNLMKEDAKVSAEAGAQGSPTMKINGTPTSAVYGYGNPEKYKQKICESFDVAPSECETVLNSQTTASPAGGSCN